ncbi:MAG: lactate racemase domain-containing protein [Actinomycetota bacterium]|nr:lactate racemase domain-containing protein [Actinomycetota bacterium]
MKTLSVPNLLWYDNQPREQVFPERWDMELLEPPGFTKPAIDEEGIARAFGEPIGCATLEEVAASAGDRAEVAVVFDDITRPTPLKDVLPPIMKALQDAGIPDSNIRFIPALGMYGAMTNMEFRKKLGDEIVEGYPVFNHNPYENCDFLGETPGGIPVYINREFMSCDLRIGIGCITPHAHVGFGGGGKIIMPGISGAETIKYFHRDVVMRDVSATGLGNFYGNVMYAAVEEVLGMSGLQVKVDALINNCGKITDLFVGDPVQAFKRGVETAREHYATPSSSGKDIVVANAYAKCNKMAICMLMALVTVNMARGVIVLVVDSQEGQVCHYLMRSFGKEYGGERYFLRGVPPEVLTLIVCSRYPDSTMCDLFVCVEGVTFARDWSETLAILEEEYPGEASVAVIPDGTMQYFG